MNRLLASFALALALVAPSAFAQEQHTASATTIVTPSLPFSDPGYTANGSFTVTVTDGAACTGATAGVYTVNAAPVAASGPEGSTPPPTTVVTYIGFPAGNFLFANAGSGQYTLTVTETGPNCNPPVNPVVFVVTVPRRNTQYTAVASSIIAPTIQFGAPGYLANGSFTVTVTNGDCAGTYTVNASPIPASGPGGSSPPSTSVVTYIGFPQGDFLFANAGPGGYTVTVTETGPCNPVVDPVIFTVVVPNGAPLPVVQVPVDHPLALLLMALTVAGFAARRLNRRG